jgi:hypothetical protein
MVVVVVVVGVLVSMLALLQLSEGSSNDCGARVPWLFCCYEEVIRDHHGFTTRAHECCLFVDCVHHHQLTLIVAPHHTPHTI